MAIYTHTDGWTIDKQKVAYYALGNTSLETQVNDIVLEDAVNNLVAELESYQKGYSTRVDKTNTMLKQALVYFAVCMIIKSGNASTSSGEISSESIDGMSVNYKNKPEAKQITTPIPQDWCAMAQDMVKKFIRQQKGHFGKHMINVSNPRDKLFNGTWDKHRQTRNWL